MKHSAFQWRPHTPAAENARNALPKLVAEYFKAGRKLNAESAAKAMHGFRLKTKHLRYTLELFTPLYGPGLQVRIERLRPIQNALGELNDCAVLLSELGKRLTPEARAYVQKRGGEKHREFLRYWQEEFDAADEEKKWTQYLTRFARTGNRK